MMKTLALSFLLASQGAGSSAPSQPVACPVATSERFEFHSHPWPGLHHFLYEWARSEVPRSPRDTRPVPEIPEKEQLARLTEAEREEWVAAWHHYREHVLPRSLVFDPDLVEVKRTLIQVEENADLLTDEEYESLGELGPVLSAAMPIYRTHFWPAHDAANRAWIAEQMKWLERYEGALAPRLPATFGGAWPEGRLRVDVAAHTNWAGAYTTHFPDHLMLASRDRSLQGLRGFETLFHEACHTESLEGGHQDALDAAFRELGADAPDRLWHYLIFYSTGEWVREVLGEAGVDDFVTYAEASFYDRRSWTGLPEIFDACWRPLLRGELGRAEAYRRVARAVLERR